MLEGSSFWSGHVSSSLWSNVSKVTSLWGHSVVLWRLWLLVVPDRQGVLLSCSGQLKIVLAGHWHRHICTQTVELIFVKLNFWKSVWIVSGLKLRCIPLIMGPIVLERTADPLVLYSKGNMCCRHRILLFSRVAQLVAAELGGNGERELSPHHIDTKFRISLRLF